MSMFLARYNYAEQKMKRGVGVSRRAGECVIGEKKELVALVVSNSNPRWLSALYHI